MAHNKTDRRMVISFVLLVILFGAVCSSYAIECRDLWDEETIAELIEDERRYEEKRKARQLQDDQWDADHDDYDDEDDDDDDDDDEDEEDDDDVDGGAYTYHEDEGEEHEDPEHDHAVVDTTTVRPTAVHKESRQKRQSGLPAAQQHASAAAADEDPSADLEVAETHLFRPVFRYKSQYTERRRVRDNFAPSRP